MALSPLEEGVNALTATQKAVALLGFPIVMCLLLLLFIFAHFGGLVGHEFNEIRAGEHKAMIALSRQNSDVLRTNQALMEQSQQLLKENSRVNRALCVGISVLADDKDIRADCLRN